MRKSLHASPRISGIPTPAYSHAGQTYVHSPHVTAREPLTALASAPPSPARAGGIDGTQLAASSTPLPNLVPSQDWNAIFKERSRRFTTPYQAFAALLIAFLGVPALRLVSGMAEVLTQRVWATIIIVPLGLWALLTLPILMESLRNAASGLIAGRARRFVRGDDLELVDAGVRKASRRIVALIGMLLAFWVYASTLEIVVRMFLGGNVLGTGIRAIVAATALSLGASGWVALRDVNALARAIARDRRKARML